LPDRQRRDDSYLTRWRLAPGQPRLIPVPLVPVGALLGGLTVLRQFFGWARTRKIILADPTRTLAAAAPRGFTGRPSPGTSSAPCSAARIHGLYEPRPGSLRRPARMLRCTRLAGLVSTKDPKLVAAAFGMNPEGVMICLADRVDEPRLAAARPGRDS
jgi:hypothetical protein